MNRGRLLLLGLGVTALLAVAAVASSGRPLSSSRGTGPSTTFFDYMFTSIVIAVVAITLIVLVALLLQRPGSFGPPRSRWRLLSTLMSALLSAAAALIFLHSDLGKRLQRLNAQSQPAQQGGAHNGKPGTEARNARVRWDEVAVVVALVAGCVVLAASGRRAKRPPRPWRIRSHEAVSQALDESLDDLRNEPDLRRAIIAAYARMEHALAVGGLPRRPAEAPLEYVERALGELDTSAQSARRLTDLFEWAKFSQHEPEAADERRRDRRTRRGARRVATPRRGGDRMKSERSRIATTAAGATVLLVVMLGIGPVSAHEILAAYVLVLAAIALAALTRVARSASELPPQSSFEAALAVGTVDRSRPPELVRTEREITLGISSAGTPAPASASDPS